MGKQDKKSKKDKHKKRRRDDSDSSDDEYKKRKEAAKLAKKVEKHLKKHSVGTSGYTDTDNPFGDANLSERFVWGKKIEKQIASGTDIKDLTAAAEKRRQVEREEEIEKVKRRREQREAEREAMREELEMIQRERAMVEAVELERKEEEFHLEQAKVRARQRLAAGRPKAIDLLTNNLFLLDGFDATEEDPATIIAGLNLYQLKELKKHTAEFAELDSLDKSHTKFWDALAAVVKHDLYEAEKQEAIDRAKMRGLPPPEKYMVREAGWHSSIDTDVGVMLAGKTYNQLQDLENGIQAQLDSGEAADPEYWSAVLRRLDIHKARAALREFHSDLMQQQLAKIMSGVDVPTAMGWKDRKALVDQEAERAQREEEEGEEKEESRHATAARTGGDVEEHQQQPSADANGEAAPIAVERNAEEIDLEEPELDAELLALAQTNNTTLPVQQQQQQPLDNEEEIDIGDEDEEDDMERQGRLSREEEAERSIRGEPRVWSDLSHDEQQQQNQQDTTHKLPGGGGSDVGRFSPPPLPPEYVVGQDVVPEEDDTRMLDMLRMQVKIKEAERFKAAAAAAAAAGGGGGGTSSGEADRMYRQMVANPRAAGHLLGATNPLLRYLADSAPQKGDAAMRSGMAEAVVDEESPAERQFRATAAKNMGDLDTSGDAPFGGEVDAGLDSQVYWWHEKYKPRKPKYFNRVHTGYEWNKYNRTHYDSDNPPPKTVQGYKFNIFYPDLIDKTKAPKYKVEKDPNSVDGSTCILRFTAGPPYEDIAFRIVNKEWEYNHKKGFKSVFDRGILHLYFNFKRQYYRR